MNIFDGHAYCIPPLKGYGEFDDPNQLSRHLQQAIAVHHQPALRLSDGQTGDTDALIDMSNWTSLDALKDIDFRIAGNGRFEWTANGAAHFKQYFPPSVVDMSYPSDRLVAEMDYAGVRKALLHRTPYLGIGNKFITECVKAYPDRLMGLAHVEEWLIASEPEESINKVKKAIADGLSGMQFLPPQLNLYNQRGPWDDPEYLPFWDAFAKLGIPVFFSLKEREEPMRESQLAEVKTLLRWMDRYPDLTVVMTHGLQWRLYMEGDRLAFPDEVWAPFDNPNTHLQLMMPIALGNVWDFPMTEAKSGIEECVKHVGANRLMWGTDMPIVMRSWTYQQCVDQFTKHLDFLSEDDMSAIMGGTAATLLGADWP